MSGGPEEMRLAPESVEALATRLAELLRPDSGGREERDGRMLTAVEVSRSWGVSRRWVYDHAEVLGAIRLGGGPRPRLRFDGAEVAERLGAPASASRPRRADVRRSTASAQRRGSDSLSPPTRASFLESQIAAGGRANAPGPAPREVPRRAHEPGPGARRRPPPRSRIPGGGAR